MFCYDNNSARAYRQMFFLYRHNWNIRSCAVFRLMYYIDMYSMRATTRFGLGSLSNAVVKMGKIETTSKLDA
jgi:hypothetical protein